MAFPRKCALNRREYQADTAPGVAVHPVAVALDAVGAQRRIAPRAVQAASDGGGAGVAVLLVVFVNGVDILPDRGRVVPHLWCRTWVALQPLSAGGGRRRHFYKARVCSAAVTKAKSLRGCLKSA